MNSEDLGFGPDKFLEILQVANDHFVFRVLAEEQGLDHS